ncbi:MAG: fatty acid desaturase [Anaerolineales bacterium]|nr:fatty acid desaturase [Anaerolineales bacterium]
MKMPIALPSLDKASLRHILSPYQAPIAWRSIWQVINTLVPYVALWVLMYFSLRVSYWLTLALAVPAAGFMVRAFIIFHDCGHGSFFKSRQANDILGNLTGILTFTPYQRWRHDHAVHHATAGDLDRRGTGDVQTLTVEEYLALPWWKRIGYRIMRNPLILFTIGSFLVFTVFQRFYGKDTGRRERISVLGTNLALAGMIASLSALIGWQAYLMIQIPILFLGTSAGVWLFYVQHNYEGTYWERHDKWDFFRAGLHGSSFYKLPAVLQWFTGNIGFHHIHHLSPKIPNYLLPKCHRENPIFHVPPLTIRSSLRCLRLRLWDEKQRRMVGYPALKQSKAIQS